MFDGRVEYGGGRWLFSRSGSRSPACPSACRWPKLPTRRWWRRSRRSRRRCSRLADGGSPAGGGAEISSVCASVLVKVLGGRSGGIGKVLMAALEKVLGWGSASGTTVVLGLVLWTMSWPEDVTGGGGRKPPVFVLVLTVLLLFVADTGTTWGLRRLLLLLTFWKLLGMCMELVLACVLWRMTCVVPFTPEVLKFERPTLVVTGGKLLVCDGKLDPKGNTCTLETLLPWTLLRVFRQWIVGTEDTTFTGTAL